MLELADRHEAYVAQVAQALDTALRTLLGASGDIGVINASAAHEARHILALASESTHAV